MLCVDSERYGAVRRTTTKAIYAFSSPTTARTELPYWLPHISVQHSLPLFDPVLPHHFSTLTLPSLSMRCSSTISSSTHCTRSSSSRHGAALHKPRLPSFLPRLLTHSSSQLKNNNNNKMVVVFPFNDPHPPRVSRSPSEPTHSVSRTRSGHRLEVTMPGVSRDNARVEVLGNKVVVTGKKGSHVAYRLEVRLSGAENGVEIRKESGGVVVKTTRRRHTN